MEELRFPVGKFKLPEHHNESDLRAGIGFIKEFPALLKEKLSLIN